MLIFLRLFIFFSICFLIYEMAMLIRFWFQTMMAGTPISMAHLVKLRMGRIKTQPLIDAYIRANQAELEVSLPELEQLHILGGEVEDVIQAMIRAKAKGEILTFGEAANRHLASEPTPIFKLHQSGKKDDGPNGGFKNHYD